MTQSIRNILRDLDNIRETLLALNHARAAEAAAAASAPTTKPKRGGKPKHDDQQAELFI